MKYGLTVLASAGVLLAACSSPATDPVTAGDGPSVEIAVSPLQLSGVGDAIWDVAVHNGGGELVWQARITSSQFGDGAGAATYVGPCDADQTDDNHLNTVTLQLVGAYGATISPLESAHADYGAAHPSGTLPLRDPGVMSKGFACADNADVLVTFDVTVLRPAGQGFVDVSVNFNNIYCSAKFDCEKEPGEPIELLFNGSERDRTYILAFACGAGSPDVVNTRLYLDDLVIDCGDGDTLTIDPAAADGNYYRGGTWVGLTEAGEAPPSLFQVAAYKGVEQLSSLDKRYWNIALGVGSADLSGCTLTTAATADDSGNVIADLTVPSGVVYPFIHWDIDLHACTSHEVDGDDERITVRYTASSAAGDSADSPFGDYTFDHDFGSFCDDCTLPSGAPNIGSGCTAHHQCWTNYCVEGQCVNPVTITCHFAPPNIPADGETESTLTCTVDDPDAEVDSLYVDLSMFDGSSQTQLTQINNVTWELAGITAPTSTTPGVYEVDVVTTTPHNRAWAPLQVIIPDMVNVGTYIHIFFDNSGSMGVNRDHLQTMRNTILRDSLLEFYGGVQEVYDEHVHFYALSGGDDHERTYKWLHDPHDPHGLINKRVIVFVFQDEADSHYHGTSTNLDSPPRQVFQNDFTPLRNALLEANPDNQRWTYYRGAIAAITGTGGAQLAFNEQVYQVMEGVGSHADSQWNLEPWNVLKYSTPPSPGVNALITYRTHLLNHSGGANAQYYFEVFQEMAQDLQVHIPTPSP